MSKPTFAEAMERIRIRIEAYYGYSGVADCDRSALAVLSAMAAENAATESALAFYIVESKKKGLIIKKVQAENAALKLEGKSLEEALDIAAKAYEKLKARAEGKEKG